MIRRLAPSDNALQLASEAILRGEVVACPTETLYGLAADATNSVAVARVFALKRRQPDKPVPIIVADMEMARSIVLRIPPGAEKLIARFWPGPLTIIFDAAPSIPETLTAGTGTVGIRVSSGEVAMRLTRMTKKPLTATSANLSGAGDPSDPEIIARDVGHGIAVMIDAGKLEPGPGSSVVDPRGRSLKILREGAIPSQQLLEAWNAY